MSDKFVWRVKRAASATLTSGSLLLLAAGSACSGGADDARSADEGVDSARDALILNVHNGVDDIWTSSERVNITYCVSRTFGVHYPRAVHEMYQATQDWERSAYVKFVHRAEHDGNCTSDNPAVVFPVHDIFLGTGEAGAESFPPHYFHEGLSRSLGITLIAYDTLDRSVDRRTSRGTFAHEIGHILGFRHEHIRPEAIAQYGDVCFNEPVSEGYDPWRTIAGYTQYDPSSVMHYGNRGCGPLKDYALTATDRGAAHRVYPSPTRCEVWNGGTRLGLTTLATPTSADDGENKCRTYATSNFPNSGRLFAHIERRADHFRAVMRSSNARPCAYADSILFWTPGVGFRRPADVLSHELIVGRVNWSPAEPTYDNFILARFGSEVNGQVGYLYDKTSGFIKNGLSRNVSLCGNDSSMVWEVARSDTALWETVEGQPVNGTLRALAYNGFTLSIDGMGGDDTFYGGNGNDVFTDLTGDNAASGFSGNDTLRLCNYSAIDCGSGTDTAHTCRADTTGSVLACETRSTF